jgi:Domain of unknown function (DUF4249)
MYYFKILLFKTAAVALVAATCCQCNPDLEDFQLTPEEPRLVLYGFFSPDSVVRIRVSRLSAPLDQSVPPPVRQAQVVLYENAKPTDTLRYTPQSDDYVSPRNIRPDIGKAYHVRVTATGLPPAQSSPETILPKPNFRLSLKDSLRNTANGQERVTYVELNSGVKIPDFCALYARIPDPNTTAAAFFDLIGNFDCLNGYYSGPSFNAYDWSCVPANAQTIVLKAPYARSPGKPRTLYFWIGNASRAFWNFHESLSTQRDDPLTALFFEPSSVKSNIDGGYGLVAALSPQYLSFPF